jgi:hypothetical protein
MSSINWRASAVSASTVYHDLFLGDTLVRDVWIAEFDLDGVRVFQFVRIPVGSMGMQVRAPMRSTFDEAKADAAMHYANEELERP